MKITNKMKTNVKFENIDIGEAFSYEGNFYLRTENSYEDDFSGEYDNAVCLSDGILHYFSDVTVVLPLDVELIVK